MLRRVIHSSELFVNFVLALDLTLSKLPHKHLMRTTEAIIVCEEHKPLCALYCQWVEAPDVSAVANCFRMSRWTADDIRAP